MTDDTEGPGAGHNEPPDDLEILRQRLADENDRIVRRKDELLESAERMPDKVDSEEMAGKFTDQIKLVSAAIKAAEGARVAQKEPYRMAAGAVDGFFKGISEPLAKLKTKISKPLHDWNVALEAEERRKRQEAARLAQEEADRKARELREREEAEAAERQRVEREKYEREEAERREREREKYEREEAERRQQEAANEEERIRARAAEEKRQREAAERREAEAEAREKREADARAEQARKDQEALDDAVAAEEKAAAAAKAAEAKAADLSRTRGDHGAVSSLSTYWAGEITSIDDLDLEPLRHLINPEALQKAVNAYVKAGNRKLGGVHIHEKRRTTVR